MHQTNYIQSFLKRNNQRNCNPSSMILPTDEYFPKEEKEEQESPNPVEIKKAQKGAGELQWLSVKTRPDVSYSVLLVSSAMVNDPLTAIARFKRILRYLKRTEEVGLNYDYAENDEPMRGLDGNSDSSFAPGGGHS